MPKSRRRAYVYGHMAEWLACLWLMAKCYRIISRRWRSKVGEIDIIAYKNNTIVAVEVKARRTHEEAIFAITPRQRERINRALQLFVQKHKNFSACRLRFDVIAITLTHLPKHLPDAWREV